MSGISVIPLFLLSKKNGMILFQNIMDNSIHVFSFLCIQNFVSLKKTSANNNLSILNVAEK